MSTRYTPNSLQRAQQNADIDPRWFVAPVLVVTFMLGLLMLSTTMLDAHDPVQESLASQAEPSLPPSA
jgi:hypothetical protein